MKKVQTCLILLSACPLMAPAASATWGGFISTGKTTGIGNPSCAPVSAGHVACAVRSGKSVIMVNEFSGTKWGTWKSLAGAVSSDPSCTSDGAGKVYCAATAANGGLEVTVLSGGAWSTPTDVSAALYSAPSCAELAAGQVLCAARSATGGLSWSLYNGTAWSKFANLATSTVSAPSCTGDHNGGVICAVFTSAEVTLVNRFNGTSWEGFLNLGGTAGGNPDCTVFTAADPVLCFAKAIGGSIFATVFKGGNWVTGDWSTYTNLGGLVNDNASCTSQATGELVCGVIGQPTPGNAFYADVFNGSGWSGWTLIGGGGTGFGSPSCAALGSGKVVCVIMGLNNKLTSIVGP
jgi:hypothetical protein